MHIFTERANLFTTERGDHLELNICSDEEGLNGGDVDIQLNEDEIRELIKELERFVRDREVLY